MALYACWVRWMPSQLTRRAGFAHTLVPGVPHIKFMLKLYPPPAPQHAWRSESCSNPATKDQDVLPTLIRHLWPL